MRFVEGAHLGERPGNDRYLFVQPNLAALRAVSASKMNVTPDAPVSAGVMSSAPSASGEPPSPVAVRHQSIAPHSAATRSNGVNYLKGLDSQNISFSENLGQADRRALFYARNGRKTLRLTRDRIVFDITRVREKAHSPSTAERTSAMWPAPNPSGQTDTLTPSFQLAVGGADPTLKLVADQPGPGVFNYFIGRDQAYWHTGAKGAGHVPRRMAWRRHASVRCQTRPRRGVSG